MENLISKKTNIYVHPNEVPPRTNEKLTVIFDLDETLLTTSGSLLILRAGIYYLVELFLDQRFEFIIWTAAQKEHAENCVKYFAFHHLYPKYVICMGSWFTNVQYYEKNIQLLCNNNNRTISSTILIDDRWINGNSFPYNFIGVYPHREFSPNDIVLKQLSIILKTLVEQNDSVENFIKHKLSSINNIYVCEEVYLFLEMVITCYVLQSYTDQSEKVVSNIIGQFVID